MPAHSHSRLWAGMIALGVVSLLLGVLIGRSTAPAVVTGPAEPPLVAVPSPVPSTASALPTLAPSSESTAAPPTAAPPSPAGPSPDPAGPSVTVSGRPGENVLAAAGSGDDVLLFTASRTGWTIETTSRCPGQDDFVLTVRRDDQVVGRLAQTAGKAAVVIGEAGDHVLAVGGTCTWTVRAVA